MRQLLLWWIPIALFHLVAGLSQLVVQDSHGFRFSLLAKSGVVNIVLAFHAGIVSSMLEGYATGVIWIPLVLLGCWYVVYAAFTFGYRYQDSKFSWFNGIIRRTVSAAEICRVVMRKKEGQIVKINLVTNDRHITVRNDFPEVAGLVRRLAKDHGIPVSEESLPRWSV